MIIYTPIGTNVKYYLWDPMIFLIKFLNIGIIGYII
jgi:hypothetical protein